jgi:hypothetical protein
MFSAKLRQCGEAPDFFQTDRAEQVAENDSIAMRGA